jgi:hypothetical protein
MLHRLAIFKLLSRRFFQILAAINKMILPKYSRRDLNNLSRIDKFIIGYRYYVTIHAVEEDE